MNASLIYGPQAQKHTCICKLLAEVKLFTVCTEQARSPYTEHAASRLPNLTPLEGKVRFIQAQDQQMLLHVVREWQQCLLTRSIL